ncbi:MAG: ATP-grasp domain-containing protein [Oscillospiraceae bacterium]|jgi:biotin carboxylase|nr:ATP-grasp domain-containing protein [Oscillospiraceae bacterium]
MKSIVFLGSHKSGSSYEAIRAADNMGYYTILLTDRPSYIDKRLDFPHAHSVRLCNLDDLDEIRGALERLAMEHFEIRAIVSFVDPHCRTAALLSHEKGLKHFSISAITAMLDKAQSRALLAGSPYSPFYRVTDDAANNAKAPREMPLVLKAPVSTGSKDVYLAWTALEYQKALDNLREQYPDAPILVERFVNGPQYLVETLTIDGKVHIIAMIEQEISFSGRFIVTGYKIITRTAGGCYRSLKEAAESIIQLHGMRDGPCHLELRRFHNGWKLIEANPRISGGAMNLFIETAYGLNFAKETLQFALGLEPDLECKHKKEAYLQYIVVPRKGTLIKVTGKSAAQKSPGVEQVFVKSKKGSLLVPPVSMGHRYAYVIATGASGEEAKQNAKAGAAKIKFHLRADGEATAGVKGLDAFMSNAVYE